MVLPNFTVVEDIGGGDLFSPQNKPPMYEAAPMLSSSVSMWDVPHPQSDYYGFPGHAKSPNYDSLTQGYMATSNPHISQRSEDMQQQLNMSLDKLDHMNLPHIAPSPMPSPLSLPTYPLPYGTPYPSSGYSAFDGVQAMNSGIMQFTANPAVPAASYVSLKDAREPENMRMDQNIISFAQHHFKEGYNLGMNKRDCTCSGSIAHIKNCEICSGYMANSLSTYRTIITLLCLIILVLLLILIYKFYYQKK